MKKTEVNWRVTYNYEGNYVLDNKPKYKLASHSLLLQHLNLHTKLNPYSKFYRILKKAHGFLELLS